MHDSEYGEAQDGKGASAAAWARPHRGARAAAHCRTAASAVRTLQGSPPARDGGPKSSRLPRIEWRDWPRTRAHPTATRARTTVPPDFSTQDRAHAALETRASRAPPRISQSSTNGVARLRRVGRHGKPSGPLTRL